MASNKHFPVFGDRVEVVVSSNATSGASCSVIQTTTPGGGPPPHVHDREDELFLALDDGLELFNGNEWLPLEPGNPKCSLRGNLHSFRNVGTAPARILFVATPGGLDEYLEEISIINMPTDEQTLYRISDEFGITFPLMDPRALAEDSAELVYDSVDDL